MIVVRYSQSIGFIVKKSFALLCIALLLMVASCSNKSDQTTTTSLPREVTSEQSQLLARALSSNTEDKNASFKLTSGEFGASGFGGSGKVNWVDSIVELEVSLLKPGQVDLKSITNKEGVFESFADLDGTMAGNGLEPRDWVFRNFDTSTFGIDVLSQFIAKLASPAPDNPILLKQNGAQYLGTEKVENLATFKFQNTTAITYFLTKEGELKKVTARIKGFANAVSIVFNNRKTTSIEVPTKEDSYPFEMVSSFYSNIRPPF